MHCHKLELDDFCTEISCPWVRKFILLGCLVRPWRRSKFCVALNSMPCWACCWMVKFYRIGDDGEEHLGANGMIPAGKADKVMHKEPKPASASRFQTTNLARIHLTSAAVSHYESDDEQSVVLHLAPRIPSSRRSLNVRKFSCHLSVPLRCCESSLGIGTIRIPIVLPNQKEDCLVRVDWRC